MELRSIGPPPPKNPRSYGGLPRRVGCKIRLSQPCEWLSLSFSGPHRACVFQNCFGPALLSAPLWCRWCPGENDVVNASPPSNKGKAFTVKPQALPTAAPKPIPGGKWPVGGNNSAPPGGRCIFPAVLEEEASPVPLPAGTGKPHIRDSGSTRPRPKSGECR